MDEQQAKNVAKLRADQKRKGGKNRAGEPWPEFVGWSKDARINAALAECLDDERPIATMAKKYGLAVNSFRVRVHKGREERADRLAEARRIDPTVTKAQLPKHGKRDVPEFLEFIQTYFGHWECPDCEVRHPTPDFHKEIIGMIEEGHKRCLVLTPPYHAKSTLLTVWHTVWKICKNRNHRRIIVSKAGNLAEAFGEAIAKILTDPDIYVGAKRNLIADFGPFNEDGSTFKSGEITVSGRTTAEKDPNVLLLGWGAQVYGRRADDIVFDDIADTINSQNPEIVQKQKTRLVEYLSRIGRNSQAIFVGTRVNAGDIYSHVQQLEGYKIIKYSCIVDETMESTLWEDHFPYDAAIIKRAEMDPSSWQLIYQNVDAFGVGNSFTEEMLETAKDTTAVVGSFDHEWRLFLGLDPAGGTKRSGVTSFTLVGVDPVTGERHVVDHFAQKSMASWRQKEFIEDWCSRYPIYELIVEGNALQQQIFAQDKDLVRRLAAAGTRVHSHMTGNNKHDPQTGVEAMGPLMGTGLLKLPWGSATSIQTVQPLYQELSVFPLAAESDRVMSLWFADIGIRKFLKRGHLPHFQNQQTKKWPGRIKARRRVVDFSTGQVRKPGRQDETQPRRLVNVQGTVEENNLGQLTRKY